MSRSPNGSSGANNGHQNVDLRQTIEAAMSACSADGMDTSAIVEAAVRGFVAGERGYAPGTDLARIGKVGNYNGGEAGESEMQQLKTRHRAAANGKAHKGRDAEQSRGGRKYVSTLRANGAKGANRQSGKPLSRRVPPSGDGWAERIARGLAKYREETLKLSVPEAARKHKIDQHLWYRIESGALKQTTGQHIDDVLRKLGLKFEDLLKLAP